MKFRNIKEMEEIKGKILENEIIKQKFENLKE